jgi:hypothetical protein
MVKTRNRLIAAFLTLAMLCNFSAPLAAYADDTVGDEIDSTNRIVLKWYSTLEMTFDENYTIYYLCKEGPVKVYYPINTPDSDMAEIEKRLSAILECTTWRSDYQYCYPVDSSLNPILTGKDEKPINTGEAFRAYVNDLLAEPVNSHYYKFESGIGASQNQTSYELDGYTLYTPSTDDTPVPGNASTASDESEDTGSGSISGSDPALGAVAAPEADSDPICKLITAAGLFAVASQLAIGFNWDALPIHKVEGTLTDTTGAPVANATVALEKNGKTVKTVTSDASGHFKAYVPQGEYNLFATMGEKTAIYTAYTADEGISAELLLQDSE